MNTKSTSAAVYTVIGALCIAFGLYLAFAQERTLLGVLILVAGMGFLGSAKTKDSQQFINAQTQAYLSSNPTAKQLPDEVIACAKIEGIIDNKQFADRGVKVVSIDPKDTVNLVLTNDCLYDGVFKGYRRPDAASADIAFVKGTEFQASTRVQMDEDRMAAAGMMAGALGVAAMNAASAREANAQGGAVVGYRSGNFRFMLSVRKDQGHVWVMIIRKDLIKKLGNPFPEKCNVREGKYYNAYFCQLLPGGLCVQSATQMTAFLKKAVSEK